MKADKLAVTVGKNLVWKASVGGVYIANAEQNDDNDGGAASLLISPYIIDGALPPHESLRITICGSFPNGTDEKYLEVYFDEEAELPASGVLLGQSGLIINAVDWQIDLLIMARSDTVIVGSFEFKYNGQTERILNTFVETVASLAATGYELNLISTTDTSAGSTPFASEFCYLMDYKSYKTP